MRLLVPQMRPAGPMSIISRMYGPEASILDRSYDETLFASEGEYLIELGDAVIAVKHEDGKVKLNQLLNTITGELPIRTGMTTVQASSSVIVMRSAGALNATEPSLRSKATSSLRAASRKV